LTGPAAPQERVTFDVAVIGAGVIGLCCALFLARAGCSVVVIDAAEPGQGASTSNSGWVTRMFSDPLPGPGVIGTSVRSLLQSGGPLAVQLRPDPGFLWWLLGFWRNCNQRKFEQGVAALVRLNQPTFDLYDTLMERYPGLSCRQSGILMACHRPSMLEHLLALTDLMRGFGWRDKFSVLDSAAVTRAEPALNEPVVGGILASQDRHLVPANLRTTLVSALRAADVPIRSAEPVVGIEHRSGRVKSVRTRSCELPARAVVIAAGVWTSQLTRMLGVRLPIQAGKGYVLDYSPEPVQLRRPLYLCDERLAVSPLDRSVRVAGTMELSGINTTIRRARTGAIARAASRHIRGWPSGLGTPGITVGSGLRPMTPDGLPVIGPMPEFDNVYVATGHAMLGITLGPATGQLIATMVTTGVIPEVAYPFAVSRLIGKGGS
jgi:D-amino-acid dehydrogenase